jgi:hypothetical protein
MGAHNTLAIERALQDIQDGLAVVFFDPDGAATDTVLSLFPEERDLILFDPSDYKYPVAWNPLAGVPVERRALVASQYVDAFRSAYKYTAIATPDFNLTLYTCIATLLDNPEGTLFGVKYLITSDTYRKEMLKTLEDDVVKDLWDDLEQIDKRTRDQQVKSTRSNLSLLIADPRIRNVIGQKDSAFTFQDVLDRKQVLLIRLPIRQLGKVKTAILGLMLMSQLAAAEGECATYVLSPHRFEGGSLDDLIEDERFNLTVSHTFLNELSEELQAALFGHMDERVYFRLGIEDSERIHKTIPPNNTKAKLHKLRDNEARTFIGAYQYEETVEPVSEGNLAWARKLRNQSRRQHGSKRVHVAQKLKEFLGGM